MAEFYKTRETVQDYIRAAKDVNGGELIQELKNFLPSDASLLELGSGPGTDWQLLAKDYQVTGSDYSRVFLDHLQTQYPQGQFLKIDASKLNIDQTFDGIYSNKVLHHLRDDELEQSIERQHNLLSTNGIICHSFWRGEGTELFNGMFVNYHDKTELVMLFESFFAILHLEPYDEFEADDSLLLIARKK